MKKKWFQAVVFFGFFVLTLPANIKLTLVDKWEFENDFLGYVFFSVIDKDDHIVGTFYKIGNRLITPEKIIEIAPRGQGPSDLMNIMGVFHYKGNIAFVERPEKIKIFEKKNDTYKWKETVWLKRGFRMHIIKNGIFYDDKFFLAGYETVSSKGQEEKAAFLRIYDADGKHIKSLIERSYQGPHQNYLKQKYVAPYKDRVLFVSEDQMKVWVISVKNLKILQTVELEVPEFYKKLPETFYVWKKYNSPEENFSRDVEDWSTSYSRINKIAVIENCLVLQLRTCTEKLKRYALLFYDAKSFKPKGTIYTDDLLMAVKADRMYFHAGGDPGRDEEVEDCRICIYQLGMDNEKQ